MKKIILSLSAVTALSFSSFGQNWNWTGNSVTNNTHFLGTNNSAHLDFRTAGTQRMRITSAGLIGIGTGYTTPAAGLHLLSNASLSMQIETSGANNADLAFKSGSNQADILNYNSTGTLTSVFRFGSNVTGSSLAFTSYLAGTPTEFFRVTETGNFGVATSTPTARFHVADNNGNTVDSRLQGFTLIDGTQASLLFGQTTGATYGEWGIEYNTLKGGLNFWKPAGGTTGLPGSNYHLFIANNGNVSIGTDNSFGYKLAVKGNMIAEQVVVKLYGTWPDFVFSKDHSMMNLYEVEKFISKNSHLPNVPSAKEVAEKGIDLGEMNKILLQKIEELTLYMIEQQKQIDVLKSK